MLLVSLALIWGGGAAALVFLLVRYRKTRGADEAFAAQVFSLLTVMLVPVNLSFLTTYFLRVGGWGEGGTALQVARAVFLAVVSLAWLLLALPRVGPASRFWFWPTAGVLVAAYAALDLAGLSGLASLVPLVIAVLLAALGALSPPVFLFAALALTGVLSGLGLAFSAPGNLPLGDLGYAALCLVFAFVRNPAEPKPAPREPVSAADLNLDGWSLTDREREITVLLNQGLAGKEIAFQLRISSMTVKNHIYNIYQKTGARGRVELFHKMQKKTP